jgi:hypothetical protein
MGRRKAKPLFKDTEVAGEVQPLRSDRTRVWLGRHDWSEEEVPNTTLKHQPFAELLNKMEVEDADQ